MGLLECASDASIWRGYDYYKAKKVQQLKAVGDHVFSAAVLGSAADAYTVELHLDHPRRSKCNCPHANGRRIICKHIVAAYFTACPEEAERFYAEAMAYQEEEEQRQADQADRVRRYVSHMKKSELQQALLQLLFHGPEWQYDYFIKSNQLDED